nr:hypothetical protein [Trinickia mobilis]
MRHRELDRASGCAKLSARLAAAAVKVRDDLLGQRKERRCRGRQRYRIGASVEKRRPVPDFERLDAPAKRRLRGVARLGRVGKIAQFRNRNEVFKPFKFHALSPVFPDVDG